MTASFAPDKQKLLDHMLADGHAAGQRTNAKIAKTASRKAKSATTKEERDKQTRISSRAVNQAIRERSIRDELMRMRKKGYMKKGK